MTHHHPRCHFIQYGGGNCDCDYGNPPAPADGLPEPEIVAWIEHHKGGDNLVWDQPYKEATPLVKKKDCDDLRAKAQELQEQNSKNTLAFATVVNELTKRAESAEAALAAALEREKAAEGCICKGNWRAIVKECEPMFDKDYRDDKGNEYKFVGVLHAEDDYYYVMYGERLRLLSCVGSIENYGYEPIDAALGGKP